jgi:hypothetical protein
MLSEIAAICLDNLKWTQSSSIPEVSSTAHFAGAGVEFVVGILRGVMNGNTKVLK